MKPSRIFQYALLTLLVGPLVGSVLWGAKKAIAQAVNSSGLSTSKGGATNVTVVTPPNDIVSGPTNLTGAGNVSVVAQGSGSTGIDIRGTGTGMTFLFEGSVDGTNYISIPCVVPNTGAIVTGTSANGTWTCQSAGYQNVRARLTAISGGTATITLNASAGSNQPPIGTQGTSTNITAVGGNAVTTTVPVSGTVTATVGVPTNITPTDCSGTIATGNTAQNAFTANAARKGFVIANIDTTEVMWISFTGTAAASGTGSYPLAPATATTFAQLNSFTSPYGFGMNTALSVVAGTSAHKYTCTVW